MSGYLAGKVWHSDLPRDIKAVAACLADEANDRGDGIYPSIAYIAWKIGTNERTIQRTMAELRRIGVLVQTGSKQFGRVFVPIYRMHVSKLPTRAPWRGREGDCDDVTPQSPRQPRGDSHDVTSQGDGVTKSAPRGDKALSPNPLENPLDKTLKPKQGASAPLLWSPAVELVAPELWKAFVEMRKKIRKPLTDKAAQLICAELQRFKERGLNHIKSLENSIRNGWQDVYEPKEPKYGKGGADRAARNAVNSGRSEGYGPERASRVVFEV